MRRDIIVLTVALVAACPATTDPATAQILQNVPADTAVIEHITFPSVTPSGAFSASKGLGKDVSHATVTGELYIPRRRDSALLPVMLVMHGSGGLAFDGDHGRDWAAELNSWGVAALIVDSFGPRGIKETIVDQTRISVWAQVADAFAALKELAKDSRIDRSRIGVMGFSRGGQVAAYTALESPRRALTKGDLHFAVHIPFYPGCAGEFIDVATDKSPMLFLHGELDDYTAIAPCRHYIKWFESMGNPVTLMAYPDAYDGFDRSSGAVKYLPAAQVYADCDYRYDIARGRYVRLNHADNPTLNRKQIDEYFRSCFTLGAHTGSNPDARNDAIKQVRAFLKRHLRAD